MHSIYIVESSLDDCSAQVFPYNIFAYCSICRVDCKFARNTKKHLWTSNPSGRTVALRLTQPLTEISISGS
jgi:hypothetical protein